MSSWLPAKPLPRMRAVFAGAPAKNKCAHCGRDMNDFAGGSSRYPDGKWLCHPNVSGRPDCYRLVDIYKHEMPCAFSVCYEDHEDQLTYIQAGNKNDSLQV